MALRHSVLLLLSVIVFVCGQDPSCRLSYPSDSRANSQPFDFIVVGGGTAGLAIASRLSERPHLRIAVLEAGQLRLPDPIIDEPANSIQAQGNPNYDWSFKTVPQRFGANRSISQPRGKLLGGSSAINGYGWTRPPAEELDAWNELNDDKNGIWRFRSLRPFYDKTETVNRTIDNPFPEARAGISGGTSGPIQVALNVFYPDTVFPFVQSVNRLRVPTNSDPENGNTTGVFDVLTSVDRKRGVRSYAARAYFCPVSSRPNLFVFPGAQATRVVFRGPQESRVASGVQYTTGDGQIRTLSATKEVILSAGVVKTPQLLELSGIGNSSLLTSLGVEPIVDLPTVGENLQEHLYTGISFELVPGLLTNDALRNNASFAARAAAQYNKTHDGILASVSAALVFEPIQQFAASVIRSQELLTLFDKSVSSIADPSPLQRAQYAIQRRWLVEGRVPQMEIIQITSGLSVLEPNKSYHSAISGLMHPVARGSIHINSTNPLASPVIDGNYLSNDYDVQVSLEMLKYNMRIAETSPLKDIIVKQVVPPSNATEEALIDYVRSTFSVGSHISGTAAMASRALGGVVDANLKVYGTKNLRIADCSVIPLQIAAHLQATVYAIAEKLASILLDEHK